MEHVLDNPAWNALISGNENLYYGNDHIRYFARDVSPFVAFKENTNENFEELYHMVPQGRVLLFVTPVEIEIPGPWKVLNCIKGNQMICKPGVDAGEQAVVLTTLTQEHVPQMLSLTKLTNPGPFAERTIDFGHYRGIFQDGELAAMAGQRLHAFNYAEVSAVCTHPDHTGKGYARQLLVYQINRIRAANEIPYLHVRSDNDRAIKVYESLGFVTRCNVWFSVIQKAK
ncbi:GNAT family N-acetyltransferase [Mucilaginibacter sp. BT774]|uniref:GNAT family N-acetyltransferase n=1 Tax=Mucilaginibacter sp. BT774 TaxID=3062276 RepID=UPI002676183C|nr:GNAT family N-acetyltransferase [Mucilaginibacter sp. BT774]MDO3626745.1 GNAT family N-acetyltransferase [Mucilaginibacter sp. BT774]